MAFTQKTEVLIVGAGPVGLFTAVLLAERGIDFWIIDKARRTNVHSYALALHPQTLRLFDEIGLVDPLFKEANLLRKVLFHEGNTERFAAEYDKLDTRHPYIAVLPQSTIESVLEARLRDKGVQVRWHHELTELGLDNPGYVSASVDRVGEVPQGYPILDSQLMVLASNKLKVRYVIGADGYHSTVRKQAGIALRPQGSRLYFSLYEFNTPNKPSPECRVAVSGDTLSVLWPLKNNRVRWGFGIKDPSEHKPTLDQLRKLAGERAPWFDSFPMDLDWTACVRFEPYMAESFGKGRVWLAGDAAHLASPLGAQSMNAGFREGHDLASRLFEVLRNGVPEDILAAYGATHAREWEALLDTGRLEAGAGAPAWCREHAGQLAASLPASGRDLEALLGQAGLLLRRP